MTKLSIGCCNLPPSQPMLHVINSNVMHCYCHLGRPTDRFTHNNVARLFRDTSVIPTKAICPGTGVATAADAPPKIRLLSYLSRRPTRSRYTENCLREAFLFVTTESDVRGSLLLSHCSYHSEGLREPISQPIEPLHIPNRALDLRSCIAKVVQCHLVCSA